MTDPEIIVSGHLCLDLLPALPTVPLSALASPGRLFEADPLDIATGGAVSNTGLALHTLGFPVSLSATVGPDLLGRVIIAFLKDRDPSLAENIKVQPQGATSYSVLLSPGNVDRIILHCTGTNDTFGADDVDYGAVRRAKIFHLGYPPLLPRLIANEGAQLAELFRRAKETGVVTSMDMAMPDPNREAGQMNWSPILKHTLPHVDVFVPSIEEIVFMLRRADFDAWHGDVLPHLTHDYLHNLAGELIAMGVVIAGFKLSRYGLYLCATEENASFQRLSRLSLDVDAWRGVELWQPSFHVDVVGTTGAGDAAYAGLLGALLKRLRPHEAARLACAVAAHNVEAADSISGLRSWEATRQRLEAGWPVNEDRVPGFG
jgi:sugar/nucleoside kinase (ribokinase family)